MIPEKAGMSTETKFKIRLSPRWHLGGHLHLQVFCGPIEGSRASCGTLTLLPEEWELLKASLNLDSGRFIIEEPKDDT